MSKFSDVASELSEAFTTTRREASDKDIYVLKDEYKRSSGWVGSDLMMRFHKAIDDRLPDDWIYELIAQGADSLSEYDEADDAREAVHEIADGMVDVYNSDILRWLADHQMNAYLCDEAAEEYGADHDTIKRAQLGQYLGATRVLYEMIEAIQEEAEEREDEDEEDEDDDSDEDDES